MTNERSKIIFSHLRFNRKENLLLDVPKKYPLVNTSKEDIAWYALRITYSRELMLKDFLDQRHIENFIPMRYEYVTKMGKRIRKLVPAIHNLVFIRSTRKQLDEIKEQNPALPLRYIMDRETNRPIIVPTVQMRNFIAVAGTYDQQVIYLPPVESSMQKGDRVRITGGVFEGVEGVFLRIKGDRRVVVSIQGLMAVATTFIHPSLIEPIIEASN